MIFKTTCPYCNNTVIIKADYSPTFNEFVPVIYNEIHGYNESIQISRNEYLKRKSKEKEIVFGSDAHNLTSRKPNWDLLQKKVDVSIIETSDKMLERYANYMAV